ncbi:MAG: carboxypeptidase regulatory-like domain-containing protein [Fibrobacter sp.]|nr:carboxypeptidase regulatory-like domain-containing protein [Fibrobacter sp.]
MKPCKFILPMAVAMIAAFWGCSSDDHVAGNSAETGSPELAGILVFEDGEPAAQADVQCVPQNFDVTKEILPNAFVTETDAEGHYRLDSIPDGTYALEAYHPKSGKRLLVRGIKVEKGSVEVNDTLLAPGAVEIALNGSVEEGMPAVVSVPGTTILRNVEVVDKKMFIDSLPADTLPFVIYFEDTTVEFGSHLVSSGDTLRVPLDVDFAKDTVKMTFVAPLALPKGVDTLSSFISDIPLALRLTPDNCEFDSLVRMLESPDGRWAVTRINKDGVRGKMLSIAKPSLDTLAKEAVFWVNVDSLNVTDSLELSYNSSEQPAYAGGVFPTNRSYSLVWHFDSGLAPLKDFAEKGYFVGNADSAAGAALSGGVIGKGVSLGLGDILVAENSAELDTARRVNMALDSTGYFCFSLWLQLESLDKQQTVFEKEKEYALRFIPEKGFVVEFYHQASDTSRSSADSASFVIAWASGMAGVDAGKWIFVAFSRHQNARVSFFVNDAKVDVSPENSVWDGNRDKRADFRAGGFAGSMDELMLGRCYRDDTWTRLTYLNQRPENYWPVLNLRD